VAAAFFAAARRALVDRRRAALFAWRASAVEDAAARPSRFNARRTARARRGARGLVAAPRRPARLAAAALFFVCAFALAGGLRSFTPERRAFDNPIAMACFVERAPCLPSRT
jgi:hypothetical protein